jgi:molybdate transport system permease protein
VTIFSLTNVEWQAVGLSLIVSSCSVAASLEPAIFVARLLARPTMRGRWCLDAVVHLPLVLPPVLAGWLLLIMFGVRGPLGSLLWDWFGIRLVFTTAGAILATSVMTFPMIVRSVRLSFEALDPALDAAARTLGAGPFDRFIAVTLPLVAPGILAGVITAFAAGLGEFGAVIVFASNIPGLTQTLPLAIYTATEVPGGELAAAKLGAMSLLLAAVSLLLADVIARSLARRLGRR